MMKFVLEVCITLVMPSADKYREEVADWLEPVGALVKPGSEGLVAEANSLAAGQLNGSGPDANTAVITPTTLDYFPPNSRHSAAVVVELYRIYLPLVLRNY